MQTPVLDFDIARKLVDPYGTYRWMRDNDPVHLDPLAGEYLLTRYADVHSVGMDHTRFSNILPDILEGRAEAFSPLREKDPPDHTVLRKIVAPLFTPPAMRARQASFRAVAVELLDAAERADVCDVSPMLAVPFPGRVVMEILGLPLSAHHTFLGLTEERLLLMSTRSSGPVGPRTHHDVQRDLWEVVRPIAEARRQNPGNDALSHLVRAQAERPDLVTDELIMDMLLHLLTGGFHTTQHLIEQLLSHLADEPLLWRRLRGDRSLIDAAVEEMLRWDAPVQALKRRAVVDVEMHGVTIPAGSPVALVFGSANRDERAFPDPDTFDIDRDAKKHLAFSVGIHLCPGAPVTRYEVRELLDEMLDRYPQLERAAPSEHYPDGRHRGWKTVPLRLRRSG